MIRDDISGKTKETASKTGCKVFNFKLVKYQIYLPLCNNES